MELLICIDKSIPPEKLRRVCYVWQLISKVIGIRATLTDDTESIRSIAMRLFTIYYGYLGNPLNLMFDLVIPYEPIARTRNIKYLHDVSILYDSIEPEYVTEGRQFGFDVISIIFYLISGYEEYTSADSDYLNRHNELHSTVTRLALTDRPLLNIYIDLIKKKIEEKFSKVAFVPLWKNNAPFALALSHDVDGISRYSFNNARNYLTKALAATALPQRLKFTAYSSVSLLMSPCKYVVRHDELWPFERICHLETQYGIKSTFFFLPPRTGTVHYLDCPYSYREKIFYRTKWSTLKDIILDIYSDGWSIGLHSGLESYRSSDILASQKASLEEILGIRLVTVRQHCLRFRTDDTWKVQEAAGFACDSTYGFNEQIGFRSLFCMPFKPFSLSENRQLNLWELPLTIQDKALFSAERQRQSTCEIAINLLREVEKVGGAATILLHTNAVSNRYYPGWLEVYEEIIRWASEQNAFIGSIEDIIDHWESRDRQIPVSCRLRHMNIN
jgi:hypothetical protein